MKKLLTLLFATVLLIGTATVLTACGCSHENAVLKKNDTHHWYECECGETIDKSEHSFTNRLCECGKKEASQGLEFSLINDDKEYSVKGLGTCTDTDLVIPSTYSNKPVTSIGYKAFQNLTAITSVEIADSITRIEGLAFSGCTSLNNVTIGENSKLVGIANNAFTNCTNVINSEGGITYLKNGEDKYFAVLRAVTSAKTLTINDNVKIIAEEAFDHCTKITSIKIPSKVTIIAPYTFVDCTMLKSIELPSSLKSIEYNAFKSCYSLTSINIPDSVTYIGDMAFYECKDLTSVTFGANSQLTEIGHWAFLDCEELVEISIPKNVKTIKNYVFEDCEKLKTVTLPESLTSIGKYAFRYCSLLKNINYSGTTEKWDAISKDVEWTKESSLIKVICSDGIVNVN